MATATKATSSTSSRTKSRRDATAAKPLSPFTVDHFRRYASLLVFDDGEKREPEDWQLDFAADLFAGARQNWLIVPEGNGKTTFIAELALYGADFTESPWIPVAASSAKQARILYSQAEGFVTRTPGLLKRFKPQPGYLKILSLRNGGEGIWVYAADPKTGDGVIPAPFAVCDELHRHDDLSLYRLWRGKLRKRNAQIIAISTAGEPGTEFEDTRENIRRSASERDRRPGFLRAVGASVVMHEYMVESDDACADMQAVKDANPLSSITPITLAEDFSDDTLDLNDWKRLKCNRPTRSVRSAITDEEWDAADIGGQLEAGETIDCGLDVAFKWDTTAFAPMANRGGTLVLGPAPILVPPRDGSMLELDQIKRAATELHERTPIGDVVMDTSKALDIAQWLEDELGVTVIDRAQTNKLAVADFNAFMEGLRNGTLKHTGDRGLRAHVLNAIARVLPGGDYKFDRPSDSRRSVREQDRRVIDALTAAAMVVEHATRQPVKRVSVYESRGIAFA